MPFLERLGYKGKYRHLSTVTMLGITCFSVFFCTPTNMSIAALRHPQRKIRKYNHLLEAATPNVWVIILHKVTLYPTAPRNRNATSYRLYSCWARLYSTPPRACISSALDTLRMWFLNSPGHDTPHRARLTAIG